MEGAAAWSLDDSSLELTWKSRRGTSQTGVVPIHFLEPLLPMATGNSTGRLAVIIAGESIGTVVKVKRVAKDSFEVQTVRVEDGFGGKGVGKNYPTAKDSVCRVEFHNSPHTL